MNGMQNIAKNFEKKWSTAEERFLKKTVIQYKLRPLVAHDSCGMGQVQASPGPYGYTGPGFLELDKYSERKLQFLRPTLRCAQLRF